MLGLGWTEMLVIGIAALIFIGPKDLPVVMSRLGKLAGQIRRMGNDFQREINKTTGMDEVRNLRESLTAPLKKTTDDIRREFNAMTPTGGVKPSGIIKPADPKAESVVDEIRAAAGIKPVAPVVAAPAVVAPAVVAKPVPKKAPVKAKAAPTRPVITTELTPVGEAEPAAVPKKAARKPAAAKPTPVKSAAAKAAKPALGDAVAIPARKRKPKTTDAKAGNE